MGACRARLWVHVWDYVCVCVCVYSMSVGALMCVCVCAWWSPAFSLLSPLIVSRMPPIIDLPKCSTSLLANWWGGMRPGRPLPLVYAGR